MLANHVVLKIKRTMKLCNVTLVNLTKKSPLFFSRHILPGFSSYLKKKWMKYSCSMSVLLSHVSEWLAKPFSVPVAVQTSKADSSEGIRRKDFQALTRRGKLKRTAGRFITVRSITN